MFSKCKGNSGVNQEDHIEEEFQLLHQHLAGLGISQDFMSEMRDVFKLFDKVGEDNLCPLISSLTFTGQKWLHLLQRAGLSPQSLWL